MISMLLMVPPSLLLSAATVTPPPGTWCPRAADPRQLAQAPEVAVENVRRKKVEWAMRRLARRSVVAISPATFARLSGSEVRPTPHRFHYLVRAGIMVPPHRAGDEVRNEIKPEHFYMSRDVSQGDTLYVTSVTFHEQEPIAMNYPLLVSSPWVINDVSIACLSAR
jgi:hypothetical protein